MWLWRFDKIGAFYHRRSAHNMLNGGSLLGGTAQLAETLGADRRLLEFDRVLIFADWRVGSFIAHFPCMHVAVRRDLRALREKAREFGCS
jgi:hypothetical protein